MLEVFLPGRFERTPLDDAEMFEHSEVMEYLSQFGGVRGRDLYEELPASQNQ